MQPYVIGGGFATLLLLNEMVLERGYSITWGSCFFWLFRLAVEAAQGILAVFLLRLAATDNSSVDGPLAWAAAGLYAPELIKKVQLGTLGQGGISVDLNEVVYRLTYRMDDRIDGASAQKQSAADRRLAEALLESGVDPVAVADSVIAAIHARKSLSTKVADASYIRDVANGSDNATAKILLITERARELQIRNAVKKLLRDSKRS